MNQAAAHSELLKTIKQYVLMIGGYYLSVRAGIGIVKGTPDLLCAIPVRRVGNARFVAIEAKTGAAVLRKDQKEQAAKITAAGGLHIVAHGLEDVEHALLDAGVISQPYIAHIRCERCVGQSRGEVG